MERVARTRAPLSQDHDRVLPAWGRRVATIALYGVLCFVAVAFLPIWLALAALVDLLRGGNRAAILRCTAMATVYLVCEVAGLAAAAAVWLANRVRARRSTNSDGRCASPAARLTDRTDDYLAANFRLQCWWAGALFRSAVRLFGIRTIVEGDDAVREGPFVLFSRHASYGDTLLPAVFVAAQHGIMLRYVMKRELRWDPCLDVIGQRLPNYFVQRGAGERLREIAGMQRLMAHLGPRDGVLIYPEGTFFTPTEQARAVDRLRRTVPPALMARATSLRHVLPPRLGGPLGLLEANAGADAIFLAHTGFEGADTFRAVLSGALVGRTIRLCFWRVPFAQIPQEPSARAAWLFEQWTRVDDWIEAHRMHGGRDCFPSARASAAD
jgi:hypothetical protein